MAKKDKYDEIEEMDIPQGAKNVLKDRENQKDYEAYQSGKQPPKKTPKKEDKDTVKKARGGSVKSSASKRGDGCAMRGKTRGKMV